MAAVAEESLPVLTPIEGPDHWESNRRYLMAPAIMAICPSNVYSLFQDTRKDASQDNRDAIFHSKNLGVAQVSQIKPSGLVKEEYHWTSRHFVLHQNYLLEHEKPSERPKGSEVLQIGRGSAQNRPEASKFRTDPKSAQNRPETPTIPTFPKL